MSKFIFLLLIIEIVTQTNNSPSLEDNSQKLNLTEIPSVNYTNSIKWIGFSLSSPYIITKIIWSFKDNFTQNQLLGIFEGSNEPSFNDSIPLYIFKEESSINCIQIESKSSFQYIRYVSPLKKDILIKNIEVYGYIPKEEQNEDKYYQPTNIPLIIVNSEGKINYTDKEEKTLCNIIIINNGKISTKQTGTIKLRGNSSKNFDKKPFQITLDKKERILGMPAKAKKWVLLSNHADKTLLRNLVSFKISSLLGQKYSPACEPIDLILDGSFEGNYIICDKIEKGEARVELDSMDENCNDYPEITGGYLMEIDAYSDEEEFHFTSKKGVKVTIKYPDTNQNQTNYIKKWFDEIEENIYSNKNIDNIDLETSSQYFILEEFCADVDSVFSSYYITKQRNDDKMYFGPAWDFDLALDNDWRLYPTNKKEKWIFNYGGSSGTFRQFISKLVSYEDTLNAIQQKWKDVTINNLTKEKVLDFIEEKITYLNESIKLNFKRWDVLNKNVMNEPVTRGSYEEEIKYLKEFIKERFIVFGNMVLNSHLSNINTNITINIYDNINNNNSSLEAKEDRINQNIYFHVRISLVILIIILILG